MRSKTINEQRTMSNEQPMLANVLTCIQRAQAYEPRSLFFVHCSSDKATEGSK